MIYATIGYDPITQSVFVGPGRASLTEARLAFNFEATYTKTFKIGEAMAEDYADFFRLCGVLDPFPLVTKVMESLLEAMAGLPLTQAAYARRMNVL